MLSEKWQAGLSRRRLLKALSLAAALPVLQACAPAAAPTATPVPSAKPMETPAAKPAVQPTPTPGRAAATGRKYSLKFFTVWGGDMFRRMVTLAEEFERTHPEIGVEVVFAPGHGDNQKVFTSIAGGTPPDVAMIVDFATAQWAENEIMQPLDDYFKRAGLSGNDFPKAVWEPMSYKGHVWHLPIMVDPNFPLVRNKTLLAEAGADVENVPKTVDEYDKLARQVEKMEGTSYVRLGHVPWLVYGYGNSIFTWGSAFGGDFFDRDKEKVTANDPRIVRALEWMVDHAKRLNIEKVSSFQQGIQGHPIWSGKLAMAPLVTTNFIDFKTKYQPNAKYGLSFLPFAPPDGKENPAWISGWRLFMPKGVKNPDQSWELIRWVGGDQEGTTFMASKLEMMPGYLKSKGLEIMAQDPDIKWYVEVMKTARYYKAVIPVGSIYQAHLERLVGEALFGKKSPKEALDEATAATQKEYDDFFKDKKKS